jgi:hypothetical protein
MRALALLQRLSPTALAALASRLDAPSAEVRSLAEGMRSLRVATRVLEACATQKLQRDLVRICASPLELMDEEELAAPLTFVELGLLWAAPSGYEVQEELAVALAPNLPGERGCLLTLLSRLTPEASHTLGRSLEVGPRATQVEWVLDAAARLRSPEELEARVARLRPADRVLLQEALDAAPLPASKVRNPAEAPLPVVTLAEGAAGEQGLVFRVALTPKDGAGRLVVPLELVAPMGAVLERLPAATSPVARRTPRRSEPSSERSAPRRSEPSSDWSSDAPIQAFFTEAPASAPVQTPVLRRARRGAEVFEAPQMHFQEAPRMLHRLVAAQEPELRRAPVLPEGSVTVRAASAWVRLAGPEEAAAVRRDHVLGPAVLEISSEGVVVLRAGVDTTAWLEAYVVRIRRRSAAAGAKRDARWDV